MRRLSIPMCLALVLTMVAATPVLAAPPANDTYAGRIAIGAFPFATTQDTSEATTDADDVEINVCGAPAMEASVWYELSGVSGELLVDVSESSYSAGAFVATGSPGSFSVVACGPGAVIFTADAAETYAIVLIDDVPGGGNGGLLSLSITEAPPAPSLDVTIDPVGTFSPSGTATITGTVTCSADSLAFSFFDLQLTQRVGRFTISGFGSTDIPCDGTTHPWSIEVAGFTGQFRGGRATADAFAVACDPFGRCAEASESASVQLRR